MSNHVPSIESPPQNYYVKEKTPMFNRNYLRVQVPSIISRKAGF